MACTRYVSMYMFVHVLMYMYMNVGMDMYPVHGQAAKASLLLYLGCYILYLLYFKKPFPENSIPEGNGAA